MERQVFSKMVVTKNGLQYLEISPPKSKSSTRLILRRAKPKYISWPWWLGGFRLERKYWPAYKVHDQMRGKNWKTSYPYLKTPYQAHAALYAHLRDMGMSKILAAVHFAVVVIKDRTNNYKGR